MIVSLASFGVRKGKRKCGQKHATSALHDPDCSQEAQPINSKIRTKEKPEVVSSSGIRSIAAHNALLCGVFSTEVAETLLHEALSNGAKIGQQGLETVNLRVCGDSEAYILLA